MLYSKKPIVTGAFTNKTVHEMIEMLAIFAGGRDALREKPRAIFDVCPSPPLIWSNFGAGNLISLARAGVPPRSSPCRWRARRLRSPGRRGHPARRGMSGGHHHPSTRARRLAHRLGRRARHLRHAQRRHTDGRGRNRHDRLIPTRRSANRWACPRTPISARPIPSSWMHRRDSKAAWAP
jgi:hypothetical protein